MFKYALFLFCIIFVCKCFENNPNDGCTSIERRNDVIRMPCQSQFVIQSEKSNFQANDVIRISIHGLSDVDTFKEFLLIANDQYEQHVIGNWFVKNSSSSKTISCYGIHDSAVIHSSTENKLEIEAYWRAPAIISQEKIIIKATIINSNNEMYFNCFNITLTADENPLLVFDHVNSLSARNADKKTNITWTCSNNTVTVTMMSEQIDLTDWTAIGFSLDQEMGNEYVFVCQVSSTGHATVRRMHTEHSPKPPLASAAEVQIIKADYRDGSLVCQFSFETTEEQINDEPEPLVEEKDYYFVYAKGVLRNEIQLAKHNQTFVSNKTYQLQNPRTIILDEPGNTINNISTPLYVTDSSLTTVSSDLKTNDIQVNITWIYDNGITTVRMRIHNLKTSQWIAMGLSLNDMMGEDHVFICQHLSNNTISLQRFINPRGHSRPVLVSPTDNPGGTLDVTLQKSENGVTFCDFTLSHFTIMNYQKSQNEIPPLSQSSKYRLLIAIGNLDSSNMLQKHAENSRIALAQDVFLNRPETIIYNMKVAESDSTALMKAHGIIMTLTWLFFVSTGILIARYFKLSWLQRKICGKAVWFAIHRTIMSVVAVLTLVAFVLILVYEKGQWISSIFKIEFAHSMVGIFVVCFSIIQPFMALFRCNPDDRHRYIFNYVHATVGFSALLLSFTTIFLAMFFTRFSFQSNHVWVILVTWLCWMLIIISVFELIELYFRRYLSTTQNSFDMNGRYGSNVMKPEETPSNKNHRKEQVKQFFLMLHILITFALTLTLIILIGQS